jgi:hypothetical protein
MGQLLAYQSYRFLSRFSCLMLRVFFCDLNHSAGIFFLVPNWYLMIFFCFGISTGEFWTYAGKNQEFSV